MAEQIPADDYKKLFVLDVRDAGQFAKDHVPGAVNIEWRKVFAERGKLPKDKTILVYCNTSSFSGQVPRPCAWTVTRTFASCTAVMENGRRAAAWRPTHERRRRAEHRSTTA
jgi:hypothetical protein